VIHGADIDLRSAEGQTPLHIAAQNGADVFAAALLSFGAVADAQDRTGAGPLHYALGKSHFNVAKVLLENGADPSLRNHAGQTPIEVVPPAAAAQARAFLQHWEDWDELVESVEFRARRLTPQ
jgi:ankyrin repeat protein